MLTILRYFAAFAISAVGIFMLYAAATTQAAFMARIVSGVVGAGLNVLAICIAVDKNLARDFIILWPWI